MRSHKTISLLLLLILRLSCFGQAGSPDSSEYFNTSQVRFSDYNYKTSVKSVTLHKSGFSLSDPIIQLNTDEQLQLDFDDLDGDLREYYCTLIHCDANWTPTGIWANEYLEGDMEERIETYSFSFNTRQSYTHYQYLFPNERIKIRLSGNYLLKVFMRGENGEELPVITRRFLVFDPKVHIEATVKRASTIEESETHQEIDFSILTQGYRIDAAYEDMHVTILQNFRWDNALTTLKPYMVKGDILDYQFDNGSNQFKGGNEFRNFDLKSLKYLSARVKEIRYENGMYYVLLWENERRTFKVYTGEDDINGRFLLKTEDESAVETLGEYALVNFFIPYQAPFTHGNLYVAGGFNCWQYTPENRMRYNFERKGYEADILFKQGYYNYLFVYLENNGMAGDETLIEGSHPETGNTYTILVYHKERGSLYEQLIAADSFELTR